MTELKRKLMIDLWSSSLVSIELQSLEKEEEILEKYSEVFYKNKTCYIFSFNI